MKTKKIDVRIFVSYAHRDPPVFRQSLESALRYLPGVDVQLWTDENIDTGTVPDDQIRAALDEMHIFVALISPYFDDSRYILEVELPIARARYERKEVFIAPVVVTHTSCLNSKWLLGLKPLPHGQKSWAQIRKECRACDGEFDEAIDSLRHGIWKLAEQVRGGHLTGTGRTLRR